MTGRVLEIDPNTRLVEVDPGDRNATADEKRRKESVATQLVNLALAARIELWHDPDKNPWATLKVDGHIEHHPLKTKAVKRYLQGLFFGLFGRICG